jgi:hypothetical protein
MEGRVMWDRENIVPERKKADARPKVSRRIVMLGVVVREDMLLRSKGEE